MTTRSRVFDFPATCGDWECSEPEHWEVIDSTCLEWAAARREEKILLWHEPRGQWRERLQQERDERNEGRPLWRT